MNEKLKEIVKQAGVFYSYQDQVWELTNGDLEKFAELIVQECANQCTTEGPFVAEVVWGKQFHKKILEHFGVREQTESQKMAAAGYTRRPRGWTKEGTE